MSDRCWNPQQHRCASTVMAILWQMFEIHMLTLVFLKCSHCIHQTVHKGTLESFSVQHVFTDVTDSSWWLHALPRSDYGNFAAVQDALLTSVSDLQKLNVKMTSFNLVLWGTNQHVNNCKYQIREYLEYYCIVYNVQHYIHWWRVVDGIITCAVKILCMVCFSKFVLRKNTNRRHIILL